jgi:hypothetical protein
MWPEFHNVTTRVAIPPPKMAGALIATYRPEKKAVRQVRVSGRWFTRILLDQRLEGTA